ncbi:MAG TPA: 3-hydroxyacyl-CoA dehydrogenase family protein [Desulfobacterales bacterium]|nr:3-hydroxyacyl-CoA dehydrogenase family protein [Desulfobacterales bacterium]
MKMDTWRIACVGAGLIGQGWTTLFSSKGYQVILQDVSKTALEDSLRAINKNLMFLEAKTILKPGEAAAAMARIKTNTDISESADSADYVQESVFDDLQLKSRVFKEIDMAVPDHAIIASSSSGLVMTEIQKATTRPERCVLVHPLLPVYLIPVVEIVGGEQTSPKTVKSSAELMRRLGKIPILLQKEVPGYIVNRLQAALLREAIDLVHKGVASAEDVDNAFCNGVGLRDPFIGPLLRAHLAGNGIERFLENYKQSYENRWRSMDTWESIPPLAVDAVIKGVRNMEMVREKSLDELKNWRDDMLVNLLKLIMD